MGRRGRAGLVLVHWNEPNSGWINPGFTFERYRKILPCGGSRAGALDWPVSRGPKAVDRGRQSTRFQPFWFDWFVAVVNEIDNAFVGFAIVAPLWRLAHSR